MITNYPRGVLASRVARAVHRAFNLDRFQLLIEFSALLSDSELAFFWDYQPGIKIRDISGSGLKPPGNRVRSRHQYSSALSFTHVICILIRNSFVDV